MNRRARYLALVLAVGISLAPRAHAQDPARIIRTAPRPKAAEFSGSEVLGLLGITAAKSDVPLTRSYHFVQAEIVVGQRSPDAFVETPLTGTLEMPLFPPDNKVTVGFAALPAKHMFKLLLEGGMLDVEMPTGYVYNLPTLLATGLYEDGMVIFAYEAKSDEKPVRGKADMKRFLGVRIHLSD